MLAGQEQPEIVQQLLDISAVRCKPQYAMAPEEPLLLYECGYANLNFRRSDRLRATNSAVVQGMLDQSLVSGALGGTIKTRLLQDEESIGDSGGQHVVQGSKAAVGVPEKSGPPHIPLLKRATEPSVEERLQKYGITLADTASTDMQE